MKTMRMTVCSMAVFAGIWGACSSVSAGGLVGFYVYPDAYQRGVIISHFIPGSSADMLHQQGQLMSGDIITRYESQPVYSADDVRQISDQSAPGTWLRMEFLTPSGQPFWHWVQAGGGSVVASAPGAPHRGVYQMFRKGSDRPGTQSDPDHQPIFQPDSGSSGGQPQPLPPAPGRPGIADDSSWGPGRP